MCISIRKIVFTVVLLMCVSNSYAEDRHKIGIYTGAWSYHYGYKKMKAEGRVVNQDHNLIAVEYRGYYLGRYINTLNNETYAFGKYFKFYEWNDIEFGMVGGISYGYADCLGTEKANEDPKVCPFYLPEARYSKYNVQPAIFLLQKGGGASIKWEF